MPRRKEEHSANMRQVRNIALSGGSLRGLAHVGAIEQLVREGLLDMSRLSSVAGSSAGSVVALFLATGHSIPSIWTKIRELDTSALIQINPALLLTGLGLESGAKLQAYYEGLVEGATGNRHAGFAELYEKTKIELIVVATCVEDKKAVYFSHRTTPNLKVAVAVRMSTSIPGFFGPVVYQGKTYVDGSMMDDYPLHLYDHALSQSVGIIICNKYDTTWRYPEEYPMAIFNLAMYKYFCHDYEAYPDNTIYVDGIEEGNHSLDFRISPEVINFYRDKGMAATRAWVEGRSVSSRFLVR